MPEISDKVPKKRILIIEDKGSVGRVLKMLCEEQLGFEAVWCMDRRSASRAISGSGPWDCVILDACLHKPEPNTMDLAKMIREMHPNCPIIANSSDKLFGDRLIDAGCTHRSPNKDNFNPFFRQFCKEQGWT